jgi:hypothetical protein
MVNNAIPLNDPHHEADAMSFIEIAVSFVAGGIVGFLAAGINATIKKIESDRKALKAKL